MISTNTRKRIQAISIDGSVADRYFEVTSELPRKIVESRISAMPLNGRSARAGARRSGGWSSDDGDRARSSFTAAAGFSSGNDCSALSRLAAAAAGGGPGKLGKFSNQVSLQKTRNGAASQHPIAGCRYA